MKSRSLINAFAGTLCILSVCFSVPVQGFILNHAGASTPFDDASEKDREYADYGPVIAIQSETGNGFKNENGFNDFNSFDSVTTINTDNDSYDDFNNFDDNSVQNDSISGFGNFEDFDDDSPQMEIRWFIQYEGVIAQYTEHDTSERKPGDAFVKNEFMRNLDFYYGTSDLYLQADISLYLLAGIVSEDISPEWRYDNEFKLRRDLTLTSKYVEIEPRELYVNYEYKRWRLRAGNQVFHWGTADAFNPTSYFNPYDLREFLFKNGGDGITRGVPSVSALKTFSGNTVEFVVTPVHVPARLPLTDTFWGLDYREGPFPVVIDQPAKKDLGITGAGAGARYYTNYKGYDIHASLYRGPDITPTMIPEGTTSEPGQNVSILISPEHKQVTMGGIALSNTYDRFIFQLEGVYSPDKTGVVDKNVDSIEYEELDDIFPFETEKSHFASYSAGFNYFVPSFGWIDKHGEELLFTFEWSRSAFFNNQLMEPMLNNIFLARIQDSFFYNKFDVSLTGILDMGNELFVAMPEAGYRFDSGVSLRAMYAFISSWGEGYYASYGKNDFFSWRVRYEF